jgi:membrane associated rhomboid family serine protease
MIGMKIKVKYGSKYVWALCMIGALAGGITMQYLMPYDSIPIPKVGADPCISAFISFLATMSPTKVAFKFVFPFQYWFILLTAVGIVMATDSSGRNIGGLAAGVGLGLLRRRLLL